MEDIAFIYYVYMSNYVQGQTHVLRLSPHSTSEMLGNMKKSDNEFEKKKFWILKKNLPEAIWGGQNM